MDDLYTLVTFVPPDHTETLLNALFAAGAGRVGNYDRCAFVARGEGRFRPLAAVRSVHRLPQQGRARAGGPGELVVVFEIS